MPNKLLPAAIEGAWVRLRPIARSDHPQLFAQRIDIQFLHLYTQGVAIPTFERWETNELPDLLRSGPAMVVEDREGVFHGVVRLYRMELRDRRSYVEFRLPFDMDDGPLTEALLAFLDYAFNHFNLRKLYVETISLHDVLIERLRKFGFEEEVRLREYLWHGGTYADLLYLSLYRTAWEHVRDRFITSLEVSYAAEDIRT